jgi:hypothetical protein
LAAFIAAIIAWFAVLFTAQYPDGIFRFIEGFYRWQWRVNAYLFFMTDKYPPFSSDPDA